MTNPCSTACFAQRARRRGRRRDRGRALRYLTGGGADRSGRNRQPLLTAAGVAWGIFETHAAALRVPQRRRRVRPVPPRCRRATASLPPLPVVGPQRRAGVARGAAASCGWRSPRRMRDGSVSDAGAGRDSRAGADAPAWPRSSKRELQQPRPLAEIVVGRDRPGAARHAVRAGVQHGARRRTAERCRAYLSRAARDICSASIAQTVQQLEQKAASRIDAQPA